MNNQEKNQLIETDLRITEMIKIETLAIKMKMFKMLKNYLRFYFK